MHGCYIQQGLGSRQYMNYFSDNPPAVTSTLVSVNFYETRTGLLAYFLSMKGNNSPTSVCVQTLTSAKTGWQINKKLTVSQVVDELFLGLWQGT